MASRMGVREFRDNFTTIAREASAPVIVTNHDRIVGWFTPANRAQRSVREVLSELKAVRRSAESRGVNVEERLKALSLDDASLFADAPAPARARSRKV